MNRRTPMTRPARPEGPTPEVREYQIDLIGIIPGNPYQYVLEYYIEAEMKQTSWLMGFDETKPPGWDTFGTTPAILARAIADESRHADELWGRCSGFFGPYMFIESVELFWKSPAGGDRP